MASNEVSKNLDSLISRLQAAETGFQKVLALAERLSNVQYSSPGVGNGAPSYVTAPSGTPGNTNAGVHGSASTAPPSASPAAQAAQASTNPQMAAVMRQYPGLSPAAYAQIQSQLGIANPNQSGAFTAGTGPNNLYSPPAMNPNTAQVGLIQTAQAGFSYLPIQSAQAQMASAAMGRTMSTMGGVGLLGASHLLGIGASSYASGQVSPMSIGSSLGGIAGGLLGSFGGPMGAAAGAALGSSFGGVLAAPMERAYGIGASIIPGVGLTGSSWAGGNGLGNWADRWAGRINAYEGFGRPNVTPGSLGAGYSTMVGALIGSGIDPMANLPGTGLPAIAGTAGRWNYPLGRPGDFGFGSGRSKLINTLGGAAADTIRMSQARYIPGTPDQPAVADETLPQAISRRIHEQYPNDDAAQAVIKSIAPIWHNMPYHQDNPADIIARHGAVGYIQYRQSQRDVSRYGSRGIDPAQALFESQMDRETASRLEASLQSSQRDIELGGLRVRGSGAATAAGYLSRMNAISSVPYGRDSMAYAQAAAGFRSGVRTAFDQETAAGFGVRMSGLEANREIANAGPFMPGNRFGISLGIMRENAGQMGRLQGYYNMRRSRGDLSEDEELDLTQQYNRLRVRNAHELAALSEGVENRMPALAAGRPAGFSRFDSMQLAALNAPGFVRAYGAMGGRQARMQSEFLGGMNVGPISPSGVLGSGGGENTTVLKQILASLEGIRTQGQRGGGSPPPPMGGYSRGGSDTPFN